MAKDFRGGAAHQAGDAGYRRKAKGLVASASDVSVCYARY